MFIADEKIRGWLYALAFVAFIVVLTAKALSGDLDGWEDLFLVVLGLGNGLATANTARS